LRRTSVGADESQKVVIFTDHGRPPTSSVGGSRFWLRSEAGNIGPRLLALLQPSLLLEKDLSDCTVSPFREETRPGETTSMVSSLSLNGPTVRGGGPLSTFQPLGPSVRSKNPRSLSPSREASGSLGYRISPKLRSALEKTEVESSNSHLIERIDKVEYRKVSCVFNPCMDMWRPPPPREMAAWLGERL
jgi:hypothetical protein